MRVTTLRGSSIRVSVLGFGCGSLSSLREAEALRILEKALSLGITHFDVARSYGYGVTEGIVGRFAKGKRSDVTITTKYGVAAVQLAPKYRGAVSVLKRSLKRFSAVRRLAARAAAAAAGETAFDSKAASASLELSLKELGTDYVDVFLLHEASFDDSSRDDVRDFLDAQVARGTIRAYGIGGEYRNLGNDLTRFYHGYSVFQFEANPAINYEAELPGASARALITFGALRSARRISEAAKENPQIASEYSSRLGADVRNPDAIRRLAMAHAIASNPHGVTLVATTNFDHLLENVAVADGPQLAASSLAAYSGLAKRLSPF